MGGLVLREDSISLETLTKLLGMECEGGEISLRMAWKTVLREGGRGWGFWGAKTDLKAEGATEGSGERMSLRDGGRLCGKREILARKPLNSKRGGISTP